MAKLLFLGDLFFDYENIPSDIEKISEYIQKNDYKCILNLEGTLFKSNNKTKKRGPNLCQSLKVVEVLKKMDVIGVTLANNHTYDYGEESLIKTIELLNQNNIKHCGAGKNLQEALKPMELLLNGKKIKIYNFGWNIEETINATNKKSGSAPRNEKIIINNIEDKKENDITITILHWGFEYNIYPQPIDVNLAHTIIDYKNVDIILGHHSHCIQAYEKYNGKPIYYSLGNFYFSSRRKGFDKINYSGNIKDKSNYGLGIVYDLESKKVKKEILFYYNGRETEIIESWEEKKELLCDISNFNSNTKEYKKMVNITKKNKNPILTDKSLLGYVNLYVNHTYIRIKKFIGNLPVIRNLKDIVRQKGEKNEV